MKLAEFLESKGYSRSEILRLLEKGNISILFSGSRSSNTCLARTEDLEVAHGDRIYLNVDAGLRFHYVDSPALNNSSKAVFNRMDGVVSTQSEDHGLELWLGVAGAIGLVLGGPLSGLLAYLTAKVLARGEDHSKTFPFRSGALMSWIIIGSVAMPTSWWLSKSLGWNFDVLAVVQSQGQYRSYKDWSEAERALRNIEEAKHEAAQALKRLRDKRTSEQQRQQRAAEERVRAETEAAAQKLEQERYQAEQQASKARAQQELDEWNDPVNRQEREDAQRQHLLSVGCIDNYGQVIRTLFCLNTEAPRR